MPLTGARLLVAAALLFPSVSPSPIFDAGQKVLDAFTGTRDSTTTPHVQQPGRKLNGKFLHITDFHPDEYYKAHSSTAEGIACHRGKGPAGLYGAETTDCDSPMELVDATLDWVRKHVKDDIDFVVWTGDTARHDSDEKLPRSASHVLDMNRKIAKKVVKAFSDDGALTIPIIPTFGNNDFTPHNIFYPGPNKWLQAYSNIWRRFIPEEQRHSFAFGGWFEIEVIPNQLSVISLNTMYFFDRNAGVDGCALPSEPGFKHMEWLSVQLQRLRERGMKAILIGHVPPARTQNKQNWDETCWQKYTLWLKQFRDVVTGSVYGHMNIDHFLFQDTKEIDLSLYDQSGTSRQTMDDDFSIESKSDYLIELRKSWSGLPGAAAKTLEEDLNDDDDDDDDTNAQDNNVDDLRNRKKKKKGRKGKKKKGHNKIGGKFGERYQVSLVSPSVVPNYLPTIRVIEYNISGLEDAPVWTDSFDVNSETSKELPDMFGEQDEETHQDLERDVETERRRRKHNTKKNRKGKKGRKGRKGKKKPKNPELVIPEDPPKGSLPGPAYSRQTFTFMGYTQYFANLTYINNDITDLEGTSKWRDGDFSDEVPNHDKPRPKKFNYEVEYSTFTDKIFNLPDLTVRSYLKLATRIAKRKAKKGKGKSVEEYNEDFEDDSDDDEEDDLDTEFPEYDDEDAESDLRSARKGKKGKHKRKKTNKVWKHFLQEAFVNTVPEKQLKKWSRR
ncbi:related to PPN1 - vacuolar endopolyphosphatase [Fusarium torulosum]|uniref:Endopolyphosphatase n=1 Tax=Fusarium torulosum TaxID=33205 RepID=A0AAE8SJS9_9HYPO|nr:related to PPN1 - vacuolar endopolyphosphatase [Fusarium torulosum]